MPSPFSYLKQARAAISLLNPEEVRTKADQPLTVGLVASTPEGYADMEDFLLPPGATAEARNLARNVVFRAGDSGAPDKYHVVIYEQGLPCPSNAYTFYRDDPERTVSDILNDREELDLALARRFPLFRECVVSRAIKSVAKENAMFVVATALPNVLPTIFELPWSIGEFASDTAFLTMNQMRLAFMIAAAYNKEVGWGVQKAELAGLLGSAFGWRALARELVGHIPLGGGLIPKGAIAYAGTYVAGVGMDKLHKLGYGQSAREQKATYDEALQKGRTIAQTELARLREQQHVKAS